MTIAGHIHISGFMDNYYAVLSFRAAPGHHVVGRPVPGGITGCLIGSAVTLVLCCVITFMIPTRSVPVAVRSAA